MNFRKGIAFFFMEMLKRIYLYNGVSIEKVKQICYLGTIMLRNGNSNNAKKKKKKKTTTHI
jgi:hypothetical protein